MENEFISQTPLDQMVSDDQSQMLKAALPYLPQSGQRFVSLYTKIQELSNTLRLFASTGQDISICEQPPQSTSPLEMIQDIRRFCYGNSRNQLDRMCNMMSMIQIIQLMNSNTEKEGEENE